MRCFTSVVLPDPFWPRIATDSPGSMASETPRTASMPARVAMDEVVDGDPDGRPVRRRQPGRLGRFAGGALGAGRPRRPAVARARSPAAIAASSKAAARSIPAACARRTIVGGADPPADAARASAAPGTSSAMARPASSTRQRSIRPRTVGSCSAHRIVVPVRASSSSRSATDVGPRRVELGGRLVEDEDARAHRHDARDRHALLLAAGQRERLAVGEVADRQALQRRVDPRVHLVARHAQVLEAERELLADGQLRCGQLVGRCREDDPDLAEERAGRGRRRVGAFDDDPAVEPWPGRRAG